jgi:hypothetical protein
LDAPSGSGKTQLPFALGAGGLTIHHLICKQLIYQVLGDPSLTFMKALEKDFENVFQPMAEKGEPRSVLHLFVVLRTGFMYSDGFVRSSHTYGRYYSPSSSSASANTPGYYTVQALKNYVDELKKDSKTRLPIIFLDEVTSDDAVGKAILRHARNILRSVGLVVVMMSTNSGACKLIRYAVRVRVIDRLGLAEGVDGEPVIRTYAADSIPREIGR